MASAAAVKSKFYKWHRVLGLTALIPVIFWTLSGLSHPFMSNWFRPSIAEEVFKPLPQSQMKPVLSIQQVLDKNSITAIRNFGLVNFNHSTFYQVLDKDSVYNYYSANDGVLLKDGDRLYATYLARYFTQDSTSNIKKIDYQTTFDGQYQPINHLLPVWKISFDRPDGMDIYVETSQSRMGTFNNNTRKSFLWLFEQFHTWQFLADIGGDTFRNVVLLIIMTAMLFALVSGLTVYGLMWKKFKSITQKRKENGGEDKRFVHRFHRQIGLIVSFVMFTFVISGAFHLAVKLHNTETPKPDYGYIIDRKQLAISNLQLPIADSLIKRIAVVSFDGNSYYQVTDNKKQVSYFNTLTGKEQINGDEDYARFLSTYYHTHQDPGKFYGRVKVSRIKQFDNEYGFINKRLPVEKVSYPDGSNWYIETTSSKLATKVAGIDRVEGLSFIFLHKYFGMTWAGKDIRDIVSMLAALGVLVVSLFGLASFIKNK
ncbi:PepSY-associated TM region [Mucilaginibacter gossypiicola]|uniref:PepSY-associated TM region n=1 Tax=Mucilaginibacter gossypiicola TaxID=551995 RepID=A0A1H8RUS3_9SPHI|nr:PepSY-associated TM helix domain-containing protein [Mucilaginibacter gossypiicola]SEO70095.1 PepSY-associated TM region [Mucilaginibacter gossypiicola]